MADLARAVQGWRRRLEQEPGAGEPVASVLPEPWCRRAGLSAAEAALVELAALAVVDGELAVACGVRRGRPEEPWPTLSLALQLIPGLRLDGVLSSMPARSCGLVSVQDAAVPLRARLGSPERVWAALAGARVPDPLLTAVAALDGPVAEVRPGGVPALGSLDVDVLMLSGASRETLVGVARRLVADAGAPGLRVRADLLPERTEALARAMRREFVLEGAVPILDMLDADLSARHRARCLLRGLPGRVVVLDRQPMPLGERSYLPVTVAPPSLHDRIASWRADLAPLSLSAAEQEAAAWRLGDSFRLPARARRSLVGLAVGQDAPIERIWAAARAHAVQPPGRLVQASLPRRSWAELVTEDPVRDSLRELADAARNRARVMEAWGMAGGRAGGLTALFTGPSGTGKTLAAEVIASELGLALWRIDLSMVVSKYIGETEKHLGAVFDAAEGAGAVLLFDEADALFSQRSDVGDAKDRYANLEVGFLLQRIEAFGGLAVLTTNLEDQLDAAFQRRMTTVVRFGFPTRARRAALWSRVFPAAVPTSGLDPAQLAQVQLTGAGIRAVATRAAFLAAARTPAGGDPPPVTMATVAEAVRRWMEQQGRPLSVRELAGWA